MIKRLLAKFNTIFVGLIVAAILAVAIWLVASSRLPEEKSLSVATGVLSGLSLTQRGGEVSATFQVTPHGAAPLNLNFTLPQHNLNLVARGLMIAQHTEVSVGYHALPFGNRAYAISANGQPILSFTDMVNAEDGKGQSNAWVAVAVYIFPAALIGLFVMLRRRHRRGDESSHPEPFSMNWRRLIAPILFVFMAGTFSAQMWSDPAMLRPFVGVFGAAPLGIPTRIAASALIALGLAPFFVMMDQSIAMLVRMREKGLRVGSAIGIFLSIANNWDALGPDCQFRRHFRCVLLSLLVFVALMASWIIATSRAGV